MCNVKSGLALRDRLYIPENHDSHSDMLKELDIKDDYMGASKTFVRWELTPPDGDMLKPVAEWRLKVDQDITPEWWDEEAHKPEIVQAVEAWAKEHIIPDGVREVQAGVYYAYNNSQVTARGNSQVTALGNSQVTARGNSQVTAWDNSQVTARGNSQVTAWGNSQVTAQGNSKVTALGNSQVTALGNSQVTAWGNSQVAARGNSQVTALGNSQVTAWGNSIIVYADAKNVIIPSGYTVGHHK